MFIKHRAIPIKLKANIFFRLSFSPKNVSPANVTTMIVATLYIGYTSTALTLPNANNKNRAEK